MLIAQKSLATHQNSLKTTTTKNKKHHLLTYSTTNILMINLILKYAKICFKLTFVTSLTTLKYKTRHQTKLEHAY